MNTPVLDPRTKEDIMKRVAQLAQQYLPQWRFDGDPQDPAGALADIFGDMFSQSIDRYNAIPQKLYTEFLNLLGVQEPGAAPASGVVRFDVSDGVEEPVNVPEGTLLYISDPETGDNIVYETERSIEATPAKLEAVYYTDSVKGIIQKLDMTKPQTFFGPVAGPNRQCHRLTIAHHEVLDMSGTGKVEIEFLVDRGHLGDTAMKQLSDEKYAVWSYLHDGEFIPFDQVSCDGGRILLEKKQDLSMDADEDGHFAVYLDMTNMTGDLVVDEVQVRSIPDSRVSAREMICNDLSIDEEGGYCFGKLPAPYDSFYVRSDEVFSKRGSKAHLSFDMSFITIGEMESGPQYSFDRSIIDKDSVVSVKQDEVFVKNVVWEYFNGIGWSLLEIEGNKNPFSPKETGTLELSFVIPENITPAAQTTEEGYFIRARVVDIENQFSAIPKYIVPFIKDIKITWSYDGSRKAEYLKAENNGCSHDLEDADLLDDLNFEIYSNMAPWPRSMYLCFDRAPVGLPLSIMFELNGMAGPDSKISYEVWNGHEFRPVPFEDNTDNFEHSGIVSLYIQGDMPETQFYAQKGSWLRLSLTGFGEDTACPVVSAVTLNAVRAIQREHDEVQTFSTEVQEAGKKITLANVPVLSCEVWVDEASSILRSEVEELSFRHPEKIRVEEKDDTIVHCYILWERTDTLTMCGSEDRMYELDPFTGEIIFGNGNCGKIPPAGTENISVYVCHGGGSRGNADKGELTEFLLSVPRISGLSNVTPMSGGTDRVSHERIERYGNKRLRHRGRAVSARDFEELVAENFSAVRQVKAFRNTDHQGRHKSGSVCVVVNTQSKGNADLSWDKCREIRNFLAERCDCTLAASGGLHVRPSVEMTVNVDITVKLTDISRAVKTQQELRDVLTRIIDEKWAAREIGDQIRVHDIYAEVSRIANVDGIISLFIEGSYYEDGKHYLVPIEEDDHYDFVTVVNGSHTIRIG